MTFKPLATATSVLCLALGVVWFALPQWILTHWRLDYDYGGGFVARRMACLFFAIAVILFSLRNTVSREARVAAGRGVITACATLIVLGLYELASGHVGWGIVFAFGLATSLILAFLGVERSENRLSRSAHAAPPATAR